MDDIRKLLQSMNGPSVFRHAGVRCLAALMLLTATPVCVNGQDAGKAEAILRETGIQGGLVVHLGCGDGKLTAALCANDKYLVHGLDTNPEQVAQARTHIRSLGLYGPVSVAQFDGAHLPYVDNLVNLIVAESLGDLPMKEVMRVLAPLGMAYVGGKRIVKSWPPEIDEWTHFLHGADNNAVAADENIGAPRSLRWVSNPRWGRSHEEMASMSTAVTAHGRLFYINDDAPLVSIRFNAQWKLIASDAFNGTKLWEKPIKTWNDHLRHFRSGPSHLPRRLVAVGDKVFVTLGLDAPLSSLDAATGDVLKVYAGTQRTEEIVFHDGTLLLMVGTSEIKRFGDGLHERGEPKSSKERHIVVLNADTGQELWRKNARDADYVLPLSLTAKGDKVYYQNVKGLFCVNAKTGKQLWMVDRPVIAKRYSFSTSTLVVTDTAVLLADRWVDPKKNKSAKGNVKYTVHGWTQKGQPRDAKPRNELNVYSTTDGQKLWTVFCKEGYNSPVDVFVVDKTVWVGPGFSKGYELETGKVVKELNTKAARVGMAHHRCYRNKASVNFVFTGRDGIETIDLERGWTGNNSWIRGTCQYGILPANGLIYAPPNACACHPKVKMQGFVAVSAKLPESSKKELPSPEERLLKGPAFSRLKQLAATGISVDPESWPMYRHDNMRSGHSKTTVSGTAEQWHANLGGRLTQPVIGHGMVLVASTDAHTVYALNSKTGETIWSLTADGRIDSSPTLYRGLVIFGSLDGCVYCLDANNGELAWRFQAAPEDRLISVFGQLESAWPVHGAVLVQNDEITFTAGRNTYLDGGIYFYRMNPLTAEVLASKPIRHLDPITGKQTGKEKPGSFDSEGTVTDLLSGDGKSTFLKHIRFDETGKQLPPTVPHVFCQTGFLGEEWFVRSYWIYGTDVGAGWGRWVDMKSKNVNLAPSGRIMSFDDKHVYGYGRVQVLRGAAGHRAEAYHLYSSEKIFSAPKRTFRWTKTNPFLVRAMVLTKDKLFIAGVPDAGRKDKHKNILQFTNNAEALKAFEGEKGVFLRTVSTADGSMTAEVALNAPPVFDGLSAAEGKLFISLKNGTLVCLAQPQ